MLRFVRQQNGKPQDWAWLLRSRLVVILDEAGAGKTEEFRQQVARLRCRGDEAFFLRIERLCAYPLDLAIDQPEDLKHFERWRHARGDATFFLDSVDEAKLPQARETNPLHAAIRRLEADLGERTWRRVRLVISSRPSAWSADVELAEITRIAARFDHLGVASDDVSAPVKRFVRFDPLDRRQQAALAAHDEAPEGFMAALNSSDIAELAETPLDLLDMSAAYKEALAQHQDGERAFESLSAVVDRAISRRAAEYGSSVLRTALSPARVRAGARRLALACVLGHALVVRLPGATVDGVDAVQALQGTDPDWSRAEIDQLLATGLFTAAWSGVVRFHHRRTMERLAAEALHELLAAGLSIETLEAYLAPKAFGFQNVPTVYHQTLGWLAGLNPAACALALRVAPQVLIDLGDPAVLSTSVRRTALQRHVARYDKVRWRGEWFSPSSLKRFIFPELATTCRDLLDRRGAEEPLGHVLQIVEVGAFGICADAVARMVADETESVGLRRRGLLTLEVIGERSHRLPLRKLVRCLPRSDADLRSYARHERNQFRLMSIVVARRDAMSLAQAMGCLLRLEPRDPAYVPDRDHQVRHVLVDTCLPAQLPMLLRWLHMHTWAATTPEPSNRARPVWTPKGWYLLPILEEACARCLEVRTDLHRWPLLVESISRLLELRDVHGSPLDRHGSEEADRLSQAIDDAPAFREALFEAASRADGARRYDATTLLSRITRWRTGTGADARIRQDVPWLIKLYSDSPDLATRAAAGDALQPRLAYLPTPQAKTARHTILEIARARDDRQLVQSLTWNPLGTLRRAKYQAEQYLLQKPRKLRRAFRHGWGYRARRRVEVTLRTGAMRQGRAESLVLWAFFQSGHGSRKPLEAMRTSFGANTADALRDAAKAFARTWSPADLETRTNLGDHLASLGWQAISIDHPAELDTLDADGARAALLTQLKEHELPVWALRIAERNPSVWRDVLCNRIRRELTAPPRSLIPTYSPGLSRAARALPGLRRALAADTLAALQSAKAPEPEDVAHAARIIVADPAHRPALLRLARSRARQWLLVSEFADAAPWLQIWLHLEPGAAWAAVRALRDGLWQGDDGQMLALAIPLQGLRLSDDRLDGYMAPSPSLLGEIALDLRRHINVEWEGGEGASRSSVRNACELRDSALKQLSGTPSADARLTLQRLQGEPPFAELQGWLAKLLEEQAKAAAAPKPWTSSDIASLWQEWTRRPKSAAELSAFVARQVETIFSDINRAEFDIRGLFRDAQEMDLRAYIGARLEARSQGWFSVTQEPVTAGEKRRDLRIEGRPLRGEIVTIELKIADNWPADELISHVETQLADQYLISRSVRFGTYLVVALRQQSWTLGGRKVNFDELSGALRAEAARVLAQRPLIEALDVQAFRVPTPKRRSRSTRGSA